MARQLAACPFSTRANFQISLALASFRLASPTTHTSHCQSLLLSRRLELMCRHVDTMIRCLTASLSHLPPVCALSVNVGDEPRAGSKLASPNAHASEQTVNEPGPCIFGYHSENRV